MSAELMGRIATGNRSESDAAFAELVGAWQGPLTRRAYQILRSWEQAEDVVQSVLLSVWSNAGRYLDQSFAGWINTITDRRAIDAVRRRKRDPLANRHQPTDERDPVDSLCVDGVEQLDAMVLAESVADIRAAMNSIHDDQAATVRLYSEGYSLGEIADASGVCVSTVKSRHRLGKANIKRELNYEFI